MPDTLEGTTTEQKLVEPGDHERLAHYFYKSDLDQAWIDGVPITAVCGQTALPMRDPERFAVCPECRAFWEAAQDA